MSRFIPSLLWYWWVDVIIGLLHEIYSGISILIPASIFNDITGDISCWNKVMEKYTLSYIVIIFNAHLRPYVMCPWGCSELIHKYDSVPNNVMI